jgi:hypothetical protein
MKKVSTYDSVIKDLFQRDRSSVLLDLLTGGVPVRQILNVELAKHLERRADAVFLLEDESIFHLEFQTRNDQEMPHREGIYCLLLGKKYRRRIRQAVIYLGEAKMRMQDKLDLGQTKVAYTLIDIRDIDAATLMASARPADLPLAMLARGGPEQLAEILKRAASLKDSERDKVIAEMAQLSGLRRLQGTPIMELDRMTSAIDIFRRIPKVQALIQSARLEASHTARVQMLREQLKAKFRALPKWADEKLESATPLQIRRWSRKFATADTLEGVLGKK